MSDPHLRLTAVHRHYGEGERQVRVLEAADLVVESGELVALVAPSGAGKSTLLHLCGLLESPQSGEIEIVGNKTSMLNDRPAPSSAARRWAMSTSSTICCPNSPRSKTWSCPSSSPARARRRARAGPWSCSTSSASPPAPRTGRPNSPAASSSASPIARAAANHPRVILADEPTGNLDPETSDKVFAALSDLIRNEGAAALIATHNHDLARRADRIVTIRDGRVVPHTL